MCRWLSESGPSTPGRLAKMTTFVSRPHPLKYIIILILLGHIDLEFKIVHLRQCVQLGLELGGHISDVFQSYY